MGEHECGDRTMQGLGQSGGGGLPGHRKSRTGVRDKFGEMDWGTIRHETV